MADVDDLWDALDAAGEETDVEVVRGAEPRTVRVSFSALASDDEESPKETQAIHQTGNPAPDRAPNSGPKPGSETVSPHYLERSRTNLPRCIVLMRGGRPAPGVSEV